MPDEAACVYNCVSSIQRYQLSVYRVVAASSGRMASLAHCAALGSEALREQFARFDTLFRVFARDS